jgi:hypothetical protein
MRDLPQSKMGSHVTHQRRGVDDSQGKITLALAHCKRNRRQVRRTVKRSSTRPRQGLSEPGARRWRGRIGSRAETDERCPD